MKVCKKSHTHTHTRKPITNQLRKKVKHKNKKYKKNNKKQQNRKATITVLVSFVAVCVVSCA